MEQIATSLMFVGDQSGRTEEAIGLYVSLFDDSRIVDVVRYEEGEGMTGVKQASFELLGRRFTAMDGGDAHAFTFTPATSLVVEFDDEERLGHVYSSLGEGGEELMPLGDYGFARKYGWINDRYGVSWQFVLR